MWQILKTSDTNPIIQQSQTVTQTAPTTNEVAAYTPPTISESAKVKKSKPDNGSDTYVETEKPKKQVVETKSVSVDDSRAKQLAAAKSKAASCLNNAFKFINKESYSSAKNAINNAKNIEGLPESVQSNLNTISKFIDAESYNSAKSAISSLLNKL